MSDLMKLEKGKEFMSFVKSRTSGLLKSQSIENVPLNHILSPTNSAGKKSF